MPELYLLFILLQPVGYSRYVFFLPIEGTQGSKPQLSTFKNSVCDMSAKKGHIAKPYINRDANVQSFHIRGVCIHESKYVSIYLTVILYPYTFTLKTYQNFF